MSKRIHGIDAAGAGAIKDPVDPGETLGPCPSCKAQLRITTAIHPHTGRPARAITHPAPFCTYFGDTPADQIEADVRNKP